MGNIPIYQIIVAFVCVLTWQYFGQLQFDESQVPKKDEMSVGQAVRVIQSFAIHLFMGPLAYWIPNDLTETLVKREGDNART